MDGDVLENKFKKYHNVATKVHGRMCSRKPPETKFVHVTITQLIET